MKSNVSGRRVFAENRRRITTPFVLIFRIPTTAVTSRPQRREALRPVCSAEQITVDFEKIKSDELPAPTSNNQAVLAEHYQAMLHTNDFYEYLKLFKELYQKQTAQRSRGRKVNTMDVHFYQMVERVLREELAVAFSEPLEDAEKRLIATVS